MDRSRLQEIAANILFESKRLVCQWAAGVGKSGIVLRFLAMHPESNCLIVVPEHDNISNWKNEFGKFNVPYDNVTIICYASLHKFANTDWDLLVLDEVPHIDTEKRTKMLRTITAEHVLALGAVVDREEMDSLLSVYGSFKNWTISLERAIEYGLLPGPEINIVHLTMPFTHVPEYERLQKKVTDAKNAYEKSANKYNEMRMLRAGNERKRFLGAMKEEAIRHLCDKFDKQGKRYLCFCSSIKQAESIGGERAYTSKSPKSMAHLKKFNDHEINALFVVGKLIEGQNLKDIECGVIGQLGGTSRITVQELGRIMRSKNPIIYVPIFDGTKDDSFLYTLTDNIPASCIKHINF